MRLKKYNFPQNYKNEKDPAIIIDACVLQRDVTSFDRIHSFPSKGEVTKHGLGILQMG